MEIASIIFFVVAIVSIALIIFGLGKDGELFYCGVALITGYFVINYFYNQYRQADLLEEQIVLLKTIAEPIAKKKQLEDWYSAQYTPYRNGEKNGN